MSSVSPLGRAFPKCIVVGVDAQGHSTHALHAAVWLSERFQARLELVHAFPTRPVLWGRADEMPEWTAGTEAAGAALRAAVRDTLARAPAELRLSTNADRLRLDVVSGHPAQVIVERAAKLGADLIVLGAHQKRGVLDFGSTARGVLSKAECGVWVQVERFVPIRRILVPTDLSADSLRALEVARDLAAALSASVSVLHVFVPPVFGAGPSDVPLPSSVAGLDDLRRSSRSAFDETLAKFDWRGVAHSARFDDGDAADRVLHAQSESDLIVMGTHGHTGLSAAVLGSVTYSVMRAARISVLALRAPAREFRM
jgi:nucleotide-binding universal stress UspA family protein